MADTKITALTALTAADPANDVLPIVDVSDTTMAASGTTKKISVNNILGASGTATLASATITGDLTVDTSTLKVDSTNNRVGIGTASPTQVLTVRGNVLTTAAAGTDSYANVSTDGVQNSYLGFNNSGSTNAAGASNNNTYIGNGNNYGTQIVGNSNILASFGTTGVFNWYDGAGGTRMTLNSTGLGVGGSPVNPLTVFAAASAKAPALLLSTVGSPTYGWDFSVDGAVNGNLFIRRLVAGTKTDVLEFDRATGNVGIGVTPSAWSTLVPALQLGGGGTFLAARSTNPEMYIGTNAHYNGANWIYKTSDAASKYSQDTGAHRWFTAPSGTAGNAITFTQAMTLDASGNLLVGNTGNPNTARAYFRYDTLTTQPVINSASIVAASTSWSHFIGQSGNGSSITTSNIFIYGNGNIQNINGVYGTISDLRLKENIADARNYLADLLKLRVVKYSLKEEASAVANKLGFIAQEVEQVFPAMVDTDPNDGNKGIKTSVLIPMLVKAIQELAAEVNALKNA